MEFITDKIYKNKRNNQLTIVLQKKTIKQENPKYNNKIPKKILVRFLEE